MMGCWLRLRLIAAGMFGVLIAVASTPANALIRERLAAAMSLLDQQGTQKGKHNWGITDIVEVREILEVAVSDETHEVAFIVKQAFVDSAETHFGLYVVEADRLDLARKVVETSYLSDLSQHPGKQQSTLRPDIGAAVQLYDFDTTGHPTPLALIPNVTAPSPPLPTLHSP